MKVVCINNSSSNDHIGPFQNFNNRLTIGKSYEIELNNLWSDVYKMTDDQGIQIHPAKSRFITEKEYHNRNFNNQVDEILEKG